MVIAEAKGWTDWLQEYVDGCDNPDFRAYLGEDWTISDRYLWNIRHLVDLGRMQNAPVC